MRRAEFDHVIVAAAEVSGESELVVIGSQAILGSFPNAPEGMLRSMEVDLFRAGIRSGRMTSTGTSGTAPGSTERTATTPTESARKLRRPQRDGKGGSSWSRCRSVSRHGNVQWLCAWSRTTSCLRNASPDASGIGNSRERRLSTSSWTTQCSRVVSKTFRSMKRTADEYERGWRQSRDA